MSANNIPKNKNNKMKLNNKNTAMNLSLNSNSMKLCNILKNKNSSLKLNNKSRNKIKSVCKYSR